MTQNAAIKTIRAVSLEEALRTIKRELGQEAFILSSRRLQNDKAGAGGELLEFSVATHLPQPAKVRSGPDQSEDAQAQGMVRLLPREALSSYIREFQDEVEKAAVLLRSLALESRLLRHGDLPTAQAQVIRQLAEGGVEPGLAEALVRSAPHQAEEEKELLRAVADFLIRHLPQAEPLERARERRLAAFIGPCGSGKTTSLAKVAAACIMAGKKTGVITLDTYRAGALEQMETYAGCLRLDLEIVDDVRGLRKALRRLADRQIVLVDTFGLSLRSNGREEKLRQLLAALSADETHLVLSAHTAAEEFSALRRYFSAWHPNRLLFTRLDDTSRYGNLLNALMTFYRPVSYLSNGPRVPEDLQPANRESLVRLVLSCCRRNGGGSA